MHQGYTLATSYPHAYEYRLGLALRLVAKFELILRLGLELGLNLGLGYCGAPGLHFG